MLDQFIQIVCWVSGISSIWLTTRSDISIRRWACIAALIGQPFWLYYFFTKGSCGQVMTDLTFSSFFTIVDWGTFGVSIVCTVIWIDTFRKDWLTKRNV